MEVKHLFTSQQKLEWWGYGEWVEEPDEIRFVHKGLECLVIRICYSEIPDNSFMFGGFLCGYVFLPKDHPWNGEDFYDDQKGIEVHGGITFSEEKESKFCLGFDCAHSFDLTPSLEKLKTTPLLKHMVDFENEMKKLYPKSPVFNHTYRNVSYCVAECESLANQCAEGYLKS
jgi:hypothetical protein